MEGEEEGVEVVGEALQEAVHRMEGVAGEGGGDLPYVVWFMKQLVDTTNTQFHHKLIRSFRTRSPDFNTDPPDPADPGSAPRFCSPPTETAGRP